MLDWFLGRQICARGARMVLFSGISLIFFRNYGITSVPRPLDDGISGAAMKYF